MLFAFTGVGAGARQLPYQRAARDFNDEVSACVAVHAFALPGLAVLGNEPRLVILRDEIVQVVIGLQDYVATTSTIAATGSAFGPILLALERHAALAAVPGPGIDFYFVNEHRSGRSGGVME
jgi:hypothetical protein